MPLLEASVLITKDTFGPVRGVTNNGAVVKHFLIRVRNARLYLIDQRYATPFLVNLYIGEAMEE
jgi:hypothetical protein